MYSKTEDETTIKEVYQKDQLAPRHTDWSEWPGSCCQSQYWTVVVSLSNEKWAWWMCQNFLQTLLGSRVENTWLNEKVNKWMDSEWTNNGRRSTLVNYFYHTPLLPNLRMVTCICETEGSGMPFPNCLELYSIIIIIVIILIISGYCWTGGMWSVYISVDLV